MGIKKTNAALLSMMALAMSSNHYTDAYNDLEDMYSTPKRKREPKPIKTIIPKGLKEFNYDGKIIYALNQKNADKKAIKLGLK